MKRVILTALLWGGAVNVGCATEEAPGEGIRVYVAADAHDSWRDDDIVQARLEWWVNYIAAIRGEDRARLEIILSRVIVQVEDHFPSCGGGLPLAGCSLGLDSIKLAGVPVCDSALAHELTHLYLSRADGDVDLHHKRPLWAGIQTLESDCPKMTEPWLSRTCDALAKWGTPCR